MSIKILLERASQGEDIDELTQEAFALLREQEAQNRLQDTIREYRYDGTGQDGEQEIEQASNDLIDARNKLFKARDPEWHNEQRQMGLL